MASGQGREASSLWELLSLTFALAVILNFLSVVAGVDGWAWQLLRVAVAVAFTAALVAWLTSIVLRWQSKRRVPRDQR